MSNRTRLMKLEEGRKVWGVWLSHCYVARGKVTGCLFHAVPLPSMVTVSQGGGAGARQRYSAWYVGHMTVT